MFSGLPAEKTRFVGRKSEMADVRRLLSAGRVLTLNGVGGVGKSRLAVRVAEQSRQVWRDGVCFVDLATLRGPALVPQTVAGALELNDSGADPTARLVEYLRDKELLLLLDNCEHVAEESARLVSRIVTFSPGVRAMTTSRHVLGIVGEQVYAVPPLRVDDDAVTFFADRAAAANPDFAMTAANRADVIAVCRRLDGIPLAIELAAARVRDQPLAEILARVEDLVDAAHDGGGEATFRQKTIGAMLRWSHALCRPEEQALWARLSVFAGSFDLDAAENVCSGDGLPHDQVMDLVSGLVDKSVIFREERARSPRYRMLEVVRQYGAQRLAESGGEFALRRRHRDHYLAVTRAANDDWFASRQVEAVSAVRADFPNVRTAMEFCASAPGEAASGLELVASLSYYWLCCGVLEEGRRWSSRMLDLCPTASVSRGMALWPYALLTMVQGGVADAAAPAAEALELGRRFGDDRLTAFATFTEAYAFFASGDHVAGEGPLRKAIALLDAVGGLHTTAITARQALAIGKVFTGDLVTAIAIAREAMDECERHGERWGRAFTSYTLALAGWAAGDFDQALADLRLGLPHVREFDDMLSLALHVELRLWIAVGMGAYPLAARLFGASSRVWPLVGGKAMLDSQSWLGPHTEFERQTREALGDSAFEAACDYGASRCTTAARALDFVFEEQTKSPASAVSPVDGMLTPRELDVARLVAAGLANREIANRLLITARTAEAHVNHILTKLQLSSRAQLAAWAVGQGIS
jgi:predicted ATPase/DNA-binding CsgD family transcriptional regulator